LAILALTTSGAIQAQLKPAQGKQPVPARAASTARNSPAIEIKVQSSRNQLIAGAGVGVMADITNVSGAPVYLQDRDVQLVLLPEVEKSVGRVWTTTASFPTESDQPSVLSLKPNETYRVFWNRDLAQEQETDQSARAPAQKDVGVGMQSARSGPLLSLGRIFRGLEFVGFTPGEYPITVEVKYWDQKKFDGDDYHTAVESKTVQFAAPQSVILLGAALGGVIFTILSMLRAERSGTSAATSRGLNIVKTVGKAAAALFGSILLSAIITILLSRISETQFFIKVSVSDFWGAIAIGFLANYGGWALLDKMIPPAGQKAAHARATKGPVPPGSTTSSPAPNVERGQAPQTPDATESSARPDETARDSTGSANE